MGKRIFRTKTRQEIAKEYDITTKTLSKWLEEAKIVIPKGLIRPCDLQRIYDSFGLPDCYRSD